MVWHLRLVPAVFDEKQIELVYRRMVDGLVARDLDLLRELLTEDVELRSNAIGGRLVTGRENVLAAIASHRDLLFDPVLLRVEHLGDGWMIVPARLRHSLPAGGMADSTKTVLARVRDEQVSVSLVFATTAQARAEYDHRVGRDALEWAVVASL